MALISIIAIVFAGFALSRVILRFKEGRFNWQEFSFWSLIWIAVIVVAIVPNVMSSLAIFLGIGRAIDIAVYLSIVLLFYLVFRIYVKIMSVEQEITKVVRNIALKKKK